jgi:hypothetical protein
MTIIPMQAASKKIDFFNYTFQTAVQAGASEFRRNQHE